MRLPTSFFRALALILLTAAIGSSTGFLIGSHVPNGVLSSYATELGRQFKLTYAGGQHQNGKEAHTDRIPLGQLKKEQNALIPKPSPVISPSPTPTDEQHSETPKVNHPWNIRSVSSMKESKDRVCNPRDSVYINTWVSKAHALGANYIALETPYDDPACNSSLQYTRTWVRAIREHNLKVWHRHMLLAFEGIYSTPKTSTSDYLAQIQQYILTNPELFQPGDIFTPIPEPQNGGIAGITYCYEGVCQFTGAKHFNQWLRDALSISQAAFAQIGLENQVAVGYFGFDGFIAWGHNNPDWNGILEDETVARMGNITIDHYPEVINDTLENSLNELEARYPGVPIVIGEWGTITPGDPVLQAKAALKAAQRPSVIGFNYWHMGVGGLESLLADDLTQLPHYFTVQQYFSTPQ